MDAGEGDSTQPLLQTSSPPPKHQPRTYIGIGTSDGGTSYRRTSETVTSVSSVANRDLIFDSQGLGWEG
jgi:hypothetical protein